MTLQNKVNERHEGMKKAHILPFNKTTFVTYKEH